MPELPEVETVRRGLAPYFVGRRIERVTLRRDGLRFPFPEDMGQVLTGRRVLDLGRRAKFLLFELEGGAVLIAHLGMSGRFRVFDSERPPLDKHDHVVFELSGGHQVRYNDPRRFGLMDLVTDGRACKHPMLASLGPEPVFPALTGAQLAKRLAGRQGPIKSALLDQGVIAGVGNIYACEALFDSGISPRRRGRTVAGRRAERLAKAIGDVLEAAIEAGGSSLRDHRQPSGELGYFQHAFKVYGREGAACPRCGGGHAIKRIVQSGRSTFFVRPVSGDIKESMVNDRSARFRARLLVVLSIWLFGSATLPVSAEETRFVTAIADLPLMPGLVEQEAEGVVFETPDGRIVETLASGQTERASVTRFYEESLPQLGWVREAPLRFRREGEALTIDFLEDQPGAGLTVRFSLSPGAGK